MKETRDEQVESQEFMHSGTGFASWIVKDRCPLIW